MEYQQEKSNNNDIMVLNDHHPNRDDDGGSSSHQVSDADDNKKLITMIRTKLQELEHEKKRYENEGSAIKHELLNGSDPPMGIDTPLVDSDGYPRSDIDVVRARTLRSEYHILQTNHTNIMKQIEHYLHQLSTLVQSQQQLSQSMSHNSSNVVKNEIELRLQPKPKPKFDPVTQKWIVKNWDGSISGDGGIAPRLFDNIPSENKTSPTPSTTAMTTIATNAGNTSSSHDLNNINSRTTATATITPMVIENTPQESTQQHRVIHHPAPVDLLVDEGADHNQSNDGETNDDDFVRIKQPRWLAYARVNNIVPNSPSSRAGLSPDDLIVAFGPIVKEKSSSPTTTSLLFHQIRDLVEHSFHHQETIEVIVERRMPLTSSLVYVSLLLQPKIIDGEKGYLGCHLLPL